MTRGRRGTILMIVLIVCLLVAWRNIAPLIPGDTLAETVDKVLFLLGAGLMLHLVQSTYERTELERFLADLFTKESEATNTQLEAARNEVRQEFARARRDIRAVFDQQTKHDTLGIEHTYSDRDDATADVLAAIRGAEERVWIVAVGLAEGISAQKVIDGIKLTQDKVRILLLYGVCESAVMRACFDTTRKPLKVALLEGLLDPDPKERARTFQKTSLHHNFARSRDMFLKNPLAESVRYYDMQPPCWLVIADDVGFHEPYTFASADPAGIDPCAGAEMPVQRVHNMGVGKDMFKILLRHYENLWDCSGISHADAAAREDNFEAEFNAVAAGLHNRLASMLAMQKGGPP